MSTTLHHLSLLMCNNVIKRHINNLVNNRVLRENKESVLAVLEAFVHDPLINWRLLTPKSPNADADSDSEDEEGSSPSGGDHLY